MAKRLNLKTQICPSCNQVGTIRKIIWGLPESGVDEDKYIIGGCLIPDDEPPHGCINCVWTGNLRELNYF